MNKLLIQIIINEEWKQMPLFPDYLLSNYGRVYSKTSNKILKPQKRPNGYLKVSLYRNKATFINQSIHKLVAKHFLDFPNSKYKIFVNHKDGFKNNNYYQNLEWVTPSENNVHAIKIGLWNPRGINSVLNVYNEETVHQICLLHKQGLSQGKIYDRIKHNDDIRNKPKTIDLIKKIRNKKSWRHISNLYDI